MVMSPGSVLGIYGFSGTTLAAMMVIGDVNDVSDRKTHGSNIAYKIYLVDIDQVNSDVPFPLPNQQREISTIPMKAGQYMKYFAAHDIPTYTQPARRVTLPPAVPTLFVAVMGGMRDQLLDFIEQHAGGKFIIPFQGKWAMRSGTFWATMTVRWYSPSSRVQKRQGRALCKPIPSHVQALTSTISIRAILSVPGSGSHG